MSKIGIQWQRITKAVEEYNQLILPKGLMGINCLNLEFWQKLQADNWNSVRIFRFHPNFDEELGIGLDQPERLAVESAKFLKRKAGHLATTGAVTHFLGMNEWVHSFEHSKHPLADRFMSTFIPAVRDETGLPVVVFNAACGHYAGETVNLFPLTLEKLALEVDLPPQQKSYWAFHEYDWPTMDRIHREGLAKGDGGYWLCGKWKRMMPAIRARYGPIQAIVTEAGVDGGAAGHPGKGFRATMPDLDSAVRLYCGNRSLYWYKQLADEDDAIYAVILFGLSMELDWASFDIKGTEAPRLIYQMPNWEPKPNNGGEDKMSLENIKVFKLNSQGGHTELTTLADKEALVYGRYGAGFRQANVAKGQKVYRLVELWEKTGHASLITNVVNESGQPMANVSVTFYWPDAPKPPDPPTPVYDHDWHDRFKHGPTNVNGDVGPGMGKGAYHGEGEGGPHAVWMHDPNIPSDICEKLGMIAGTFHDHLDQKFQLLTEGEVDDRWFYEVGDRKEEPSENNYVCVLATDDASFENTCLSLVVGNDPSKPDWKAPSPISPANAESYAVETNYVPTEGEVQRTFWARIDTPKGTPLSDWLPFKFETGKRKTITAHVSYEEDEPDNGNGDGWKLIEDWRKAKSGAHSIVGYFPESGIVFHVNGIKIVSGSKAEYNKDGKGGFEFVYWSPGTVVFKVEDQELPVRVTMGEIVHVHLERGEKPAQARLVSVWMDKEDAESTLRDLEQKYPGTFSLESKS